MPAGVDDLDASQRRPRLPGRARYQWTEALLDPGPDVLWSPHEQRAAEQCRRLERLQPGVVGDLGDLRAQRALDVIPDCVQRALGLGLRRGVLGHGISAALRAAGRLLWGRRAVAERFGTSESGSLTSAFERRRGSAARVLGEAANRGKSRPYTSVADEAHLSAEEAQAGPDPRIQGADAHAGGALDVEAAAPQGPQAAHAVAVGAPGERGGRRRSRRQRLSRSAEF